MFDNALYSLYYFLLTPVGPCWPLLAPVGPCWPLLAPVGPCWPLLAPVGPYWPPVGPCQTLLALVGPCWPLLANIVIVFCFMYDNVFLKRAMICSFHLLRFIANNKNYLYTYLCIYLFCFIWFCIRLMVFCVVFKISR